MGDKLRAPVGWVSWLAAAGMLIVIVMGATVTSTGSATACGRDWPLCNGRFVPEFAVKTFIEFSHRVVTAIEGLLILLTVAGMMLLYRRYRETWVLAPLTLLGLLAQAALGALAVVYPEDPPVLALHFGISLIAFASIVLSAVFVTWPDRLRQARRRPAPRGSRALIWTVLLITYGEVYLGAFVRHTGSDLGCLGWPACNGGWLPQLSGATGISFAHRLGALVTLAATLGLALLARRGRGIRDDLALGAWVALSCLALQIASGALVSLSHVHLFSVLGHAATNALFFGAVAFLVMQSTPARAANRAPSGAGVDLASTAPRMS